VVRTMYAVKWLLTVAVLALAITLGGTAFAREEGWLGVMLQPLTDELIQAMDLQKGAEGVLVADVVEGSPAEAAGIQKGDVLVDMDGNKIGSIDTAIEYVTEKDPGDRVEIALIRDGEKRNLTVELGGRSAEVEKQAQEEFYSSRTPSVERAFKEVGIGGGFLGVRVQSMTPDLSTYFKVGPNEGVLVLDVEDGSPAAKAGLRGGDVITKVDNEDVWDASDFTGYIRERESGNMVNLTFKRLGETRRVDVKLGKLGPAQMFMRGMGAPRALMFRGNEPLMPEGMRIHKWVTERGEGEGCQQSPMMKGMQKEGMQKEGMEQGESSGRQPRMKRRQSEGAWGQMMREREPGTWMRMREGKNPRMLMIQRSDRECLRDCMRRYVRECMGECAHGSEQCMKNMDEHLKNVDKCIERMKPGEMGDNLKGEIDRLKQEIDGLKKEMQSLKQP
jgi:membrane-associated protease RseP (regulator of RpoE activity)